MSRENIKTVIVVTAEILVKRTFDSDSDYDNDYEDEVPVKTANGMNELLENVNDILTQFPVDFKTVTVQEKSVILTDNENENDYPDLPSTPFQDENVIARMMKVILLTFFLPQFNWKMEKVMLLTKVLNEESCL